MMPTESLILSVLQILLNAGLRVNEMKENSCAPATSVPNITINDNDKPGASMGKGNFLCFFPLPIFFKCIISLIFFPV